MVLSLVEYGDISGEPIVALHGGGMIGQQWERLATERFSNHRWVCPHARYHGNSEYSGAFTISQMSDDVLATLDSVGVESFHLVGHSMGALVGTKVASLSPLRVRSLMLLDMPTMSGNEFVELNAESQRRMAEYQVRREYDHSGEPGDVDYRNLLAKKSISHVEKRWIDHYKGTKQLVEDRSKTFARNERIEQLMNDVADSLPVSLGAYDKRVLAIFGEKAQLYTMSGLTAMARELGSRLEISIINDSGHHLLWEAFEDTCYLIQRFLSSHAEQADVSKPTPVAQVQGR